MNDPPRLLRQPSTSASTLELLRALEPPQAPPPSVQNALVKDLSGLVAGSGIKAAATAWWLKASLVSVLALSAGGALWWSQTRATRAPRVAPAGHETAPKPAPAAVVPAAPVLVPAEAPTEAPRVSALAHAKAVASTGPRDSLAEEEALLEAARQSVSRDPSHALALLQQHRSQFPKGQLGAERMYLSVDAWQRVGNVAAAKREAAALAKYYPNSAYARRAGLLLASPGR